MKKIALFAVLGIMCFGCSDSDDESSDIAGVYVIESLSFGGLCQPEEARFEGQYNDGDVCVTDEDFFTAMYCRDGQLIISEDNKFTSTIRFIINGFNSFNINGQGVATASDSAVNICINNGDCYDFVRVDGKLRFTYISAACTQTSFMFAQQ